ncbi:MAG: hypothetical protein IJX51_04425 [Clostridia bacterium]|nr:hypothetical protein [Clostridia bacterium]
MKLNQLFTSHMVLPANREIRVFGEGEGKISVVFNCAEASCVSSGGEWCVTLPCMEYGGPYEMEITMNGEKIVLEDIYIGEVYIFAGQSNMQFKIRESSYPKEKWVSNNNIRLFNTLRVEEGEYFLPSHGWVVADADTVGYWPAIQYHTATELSKKGIAVGAISCFQGASVIESWVPKGAFESAGINIPIGERHKDHVDEWFGRWNGDGQLYDFTFKKIAPYSVSGVVWYQGESDTSVTEGKVYATELCELIKVWRRDLKDEKLPFVIIQIADYDERNDEGWHLVQKAQLDVENMLDGVTTVICRDICESDNIHPPTKDILSKRVKDAICNM